MRKNFIVHSKFDDLKYEIEETLHNFSNVGTYVVKGNRNHIKKIDIQGNAFNIKKFKKPNFFQSLVYKFIRRSKARRSYEYANKLLENNINTPFPAAYYETFNVGLKESYYISEQVDYDLEFRTLIHQPWFKDREEILKQFARFTFLLHENDINFLDHSPGNTLINVKEDGSYDFQLIDLNRMRFETMSFDRRMYNFRRLWLSKAMVKIIAMEYSELINKDYYVVHQVMLKYSRAFQKKINSKKLRRRRKG